MTIDRETVIKLAREAGAEICTGWRDNDEPDKYYEFWPEELECFATLVLEHGRKLLPEKIEAKTDNDCSYAYADGWNECLNHITNKESSDAK